MSKSMINDKKHTQEGLETKSISELIDLLELAPYDEHMEIMPTIENEIEKVLLERIIAIPNLADEFVKYRFVKWKRSYIITKSHYPELISIDPLTECIGGKINTVRDITNNINQEFHKKLLCTKDGDKYIDLFHYNSSIYCDPNDSQFQPGNAICYLEVQCIKDNNNVTCGYKRTKNGEKETKLLSTLKEYENAKSRNAHIEKRQFKTKLHSFAAEIITSYERDGKDVFDNFEELKAFIEERIAKRAESKRKRFPISTVLAIPSTSGYERALAAIPQVIETPDDKAYLRVLTDEDKALLKNEGGRVTIKSLRLGNNITGRNYPLLNAIYTIVKETAEIISEGNITFYEQDLAERIGKDVRGDRAGSLASELLAQFDDLIGVFDDGSFYKLLAINSFEQKTGKIQMYVGYFDMLRKAMEPPKEIKQRKTKQLHASSHTHLVHADIITKVKNHNAVSVVEFLTIKIQQAGGQLPKSRERKEISINPSTIIEAIPQLKATLDEAELTCTPTQRINVILKRVFSSVYDGLKNHTELLRYYIDFQIPDRIPTTTTLETPLTFSHRGLNKDFKLPPKK